MRDRDGFGIVVGARDAVRVFVVLAAIGTVALLGQVLSGCGASAIGAQADTIAVTYSVAHEVDEVLVTVRARDLDEALAASRAECGAGGCSQERAAHYRAELVEREQKWAPAMAARNHLFDALDEWIEGLRIAVAAHTESFGLALLIRLGALVVAAYGTLVDVLATIAPGVHLPGLPGELGGAS
jgi:hypothetical protein